MTACTASGWLIRVHGRVQGVGFRAAVLRLANALKLHGDVCNEGDAVRIRLQANHEDKDRFLAELQKCAPPLARIDRVEVDAQVALLADDFCIVPSEPGPVTGGDMTDIAPCADCLREIDDPQDRRYRYAFTHCTQCGPRLSVLQALPYDRRNTSMAAFVPCSACQAEYTDPGNRRFHAQPIACPDCGPRLWLEDADGRIETDDPIRTTAQALRSGKIVAVKGVGGFHLACSANDDDVILRLRRKKHRPDQPLALLARDTAMVGSYAQLTSTSTAALRDAARPIVLLPAHPGTGLSAKIAPGLREWGFLLPASPLHHLLMQALDQPIVLTSGNPSGCPPCLDNETARRELAGIADLWLLHDRKIAQRVDDSVLRPAAEQLLPLRRARGFAPQALTLPSGFDSAPAVLACGSQIKNTFCLLTAGRAVLSPHQGDQHQLDAETQWQQSLGLHQQLYAPHLDAIAIDMHPDYAPSHRGRALAEKQGLALHEVAHHHAHIASCLIDNGIARNTRPIWGLALDGTGYGNDGQLWGCELLLVDYTECLRVGRLVPVALPGGSQAIREPWRMAYAHLRRLPDWDHWREQLAAQAFFIALSKQPLGTLDGMLASGFNSPLASSAGRLFDAVAAVLGLRQTVSYEGQAATELEARIDSTADPTSRAYPFLIQRHAGLWEMETIPMWQALLQDLEEGVPTGIIASRFHASFAQGLVALLEQAEPDTSTSPTIALSGGVFQNCSFTAELTRRLQARGMRVLSHQRVPANDGGLSLGQAAVAAARLQQATGADPCA